MGVVRISQGDTAPLLTEVLADDHGPIDLTGCTVEFAFRKPDGTLVEAAATILEGETIVDGETVTLTPADGVVLYAWATDDLDTPGQALRRWKITYPGGEVSHVPNYRKEPVVIDRELA